MTDTGEPKVWREDGDTYFEHICKGKVIKYTLPEVIWGVLCSNPLTLRTVINCNFCGLQGRMTEGVWRPLRNVTVAGPPHI